MRFEFATLERRAEADGPLQRLDARVKILATFGFVLAVVAIPVGLWKPSALAGLVLALGVGLSGIPPRELFGRWLGFLVLVGFLAFVVAQSHPERPRVGPYVVFGTILAKNSLAFIAVLTLAGTTPFRKTLDGLRRLGVPAILVSTLHFMNRYIYVLSDELARMTQARRSRTFRRSGRLDWRLLTGLIGMLLVRSFERGERVHSAMTSRGWDGTIRGLDGPEVEPR